MRHTATSAMAIAKEIFMIHDRPDARTEACDGWVTAAVTRSFGAPQTTSMSNDPLEKEFANKLIDVQDEEECLD